MSVDDNPQKPGRARMWFIRLVLLWAVCLVALVAGEIVTRLFVPESVWRFHSSGADWQFDELLGWVQMPDLDITRMSDQGPVRFRTNADGLTPARATRDRVPGTLRIMFFGDSSVVGRWVEQEGTVSAHLGRILHARGLSADVINAGVEGYSTDQTLLLIERLLPLYRPDFIIYGLHPNDLAGNVTREAYGNAKPMLVPGRGGRLEVLPPPSVERHILHRETRARLRTWIQYSALYRVFQPFLFRARARFLGFEQEALHGIDWETIYYEPAAIDRYDWQILGALLERMDAVSRDHGAAFLFYHHPDLGAVWYPFIETLRQHKGVPAERYDTHALEKRLADIATARKIDFCPVVDRFAANQGRGPFHLLPRDFHCNSAGYELTAELIADHLKQCAAWPAHSTVAPGE